MGRRDREHCSPAVARKLRGMDRTPLYRFVDRMDRRRTMAAWRWDKRRRAFAKRTGLPSHYFPAKRTRAPVAAKAARSIWKRFRPLSENARHLIEAEVGRPRVSGKCPELTLLLKRAFDVGGDVIVEFSQGTQLPRQLQTERGAQLDSALHWVHPKVLEPFFAPSDALLSFNSPSNPRSGACQACNGLGTARTVLVDALVKHPEREYA